MSDPQFLGILVTTFGERPDKILYFDNCGDTLDLAEKRGPTGVLYTTGQAVCIEAEMRRLGNAV